MTNILSDLTMEGDITVGTNNITMTGNLSSSGAPVTEGYISNLTAEQIKAPTTAGIAIQGRTDGNYPASGNIGETIIRQSYIATTATVTISIASPCVVTYPSHGLQTGIAVFFTTTGSLPTGLLANTNYYVIVIDDNTFSLASSVSNAFAGTKINTSGSQSGTQTCNIGIMGATSAALVDLMGVLIPAGTWLVSGSAWHVGHNNVVMYLVQGAIATVSSQARDSNGAYYLNGLVLNPNAAIFMGMSPVVFSFSSPTILYFTLRAAWTTPGAYFIGNGCMSATRIA